ncbi:MAG TPA: M24 family metallopeptidase [Planctomycetota bacterium]|nr:M24 family metallopeptidase [Planctomycetota bacterium]
MRALLVLLLLLPTRSLGGAQEAESLRIGAAEYRKRQTTLAGKLPGAAIVLDAGPLGEVGADRNTPVFDFKYLCGVHEENGILVLLGGKLTVFLADPRTTAPGADEVLPLGRFGAWAEEHLAGQPKVYVKLRERDLEILTQAVPKTEIVGSRVASEILRMRIVKSDAEIRLMKKAATATNQAHLAAMRALKPGMNERELQAVIEGTFKKEGCPELGFPSIIAAGKNGTILHYMKNNQEIPKDTLIVCDIGSGIENYVTDITRTLPTSGTFSEEQRKHYQCVLDAQKAAEAILRPGVSFIDLEHAARKVFEDRGLTKWSYGHSKDDGVRHGLGHTVGMAVHDSQGGYRDPFKPGMVITIEPGWYDKDNGYGIRIEDTYLVTPEGFERLSAGAPREIDEIEKVMKGAKKDF